MSMDYDADFISDIGHKMQIPDKLGAREDGYDDVCRKHDDVNAHEMQVPDRIMVAGQGQHIGARENLRFYDFENAVADRTAPFVGLMTPPHTLTLEEQGFPQIEEKVQQELNESYVPQQQMSNGSIQQPVPYTPGVSLGDSLLVNEEEEVKQLHKQVAKLTRRIGVLESDIEQGRKEKYVLYPLHCVTMGYLILKFFGWMFKPSRPY